MTEAHRSTRPRGAPHIDTIDFHGDSVLATKDPDGRVFVSVRRVCEALGLAVQAQLTKLHACSWATITMIVTVADDGKSREQAFIDLDGLPMWLATINPSKVDEALRPKLASYQREAAQVLRAHFCGSQSTTSTPEPKPDAGTEPERETRLSYITMGRHTLEVSLAGEGDAVGDLLVGCASGSSYNPERDPIASVANVHRDALRSIANELLVARLALDNGANIKRTTLSSLLDAIIARAEMAASVEPRTFVAVERGGRWVGVKP
jgi:hypothetical protein